VGGKDSIDEEIRESAEFAAERSIYEDTTS